MNQPEDHIGELPTIRQRDRRWANAFRALQHPDFRIFWFAQILSLTGNWMHQVGQNWLVYRLTGSPLMLGAVGFVALIPVLPVSLVGGVIIDRIPRRRLLLGTQSALTICAMVLGLLTWSDQAQLWHVIIVSFLMGAIGSVDLPARQTFVVDLVGRHDLANAIALNTAIFSVARVVGPALAGVLVAWQGEASCFFLNALSFVPLVAGLLLMRLPMPTVRARPSLAGGLLGGFRYLMGQPVVLVLMAVMAVSSFTLLPYLALMPAFAQDVLHVGPQGLGFLMAAVGVGAAVGALSVACSDERCQGRFLTMSSVLLPLSVISFCLSRQYLLSLILLVVVGAGTTWLQCLLNTLVQLSLHEEMRGRIMSLYLMLYVGMQRAGGLQIGYVAEFVGVSASLALNAAVCLLCLVFLAWRLPLVRRLN